MKKSVRSLLITAAAAALLIPMPGHYRDGGTAVYTALLYKVILIFDQYIDKKYV